VRDLKAREVQVRDLQERLLLARDLERSPVEKENQE
jgi:hypothetical protein